MRRWVDRLRQRALGGRVSLRDGWVWWLGAAVTVVAVTIIAATVDTTVLREAALAAVDHPGALLAVLTAYLGAFVLRAWAWQRLLPGIGLGHALAAIHVALAGNHLLPLRLGEALRVTSLVRRTPVTVPAAAATTVTLRASDIVALGLLAVATGPAVAWKVAGVWGLGVAVLALAVGIGGFVWMGRARLRPERFLRSGIGIAVAAVVAWVLEAAVIHQAAAWAGVELGFREAVLVTTVTVAAQVAAVAPGGIGTYEAAATAALVALGADPGTALAVAVTAHAVKTAYALVAGAIGAVVPSPGLLGRVRLDRPEPVALGPEVSQSDPVVLFLPAHDEAATVATVVRRAPGRVLGHPVEVLVVDDGSRDATADLAAAAGAKVERFEHNRGLGAAVRRGLELGAERGAAAVVFCDADGEYAPEELERLVAPILAGEADYVVGSRFGGDIERMLPHRRFGNLVLTVLLRFVARTPISDGQSGYRALSGRAASEAEVIHDFNYAQVLTLDLLGKGFRYAEVPISYRFREHGRSFVRLGRYLRAVVPAVWRELNEPAAG